MNGMLNSAYEGKLLKKWKPLIESGAEIKDEYTQIALAKVLESTYQDFKRHGLIKEAVDASTGMGTASIGTSFSTGAENGVLGPENYNWPSLVMPMLRRIFPTLMAHELVGVQPMNGPIGYAMALRAVYGADGQLGEVSGYTPPVEIGYNNILTPWTGVSAGAAVSTPDVGDPITGVSGFAADPSAFFDPQNAAWQAYAGAGTGIKDYLGRGADTAAAEWANLGTNYPTVRFDLIKKSVDAKTRKLAANWSPELAEDMAAMHGINVEEEMMNILSYEIGAEIDRQIITEMVAAAILGDQVIQWNPASADGNNQMERIATLLTTLTVEAQQIAIRSRRGNANFVVASPKVTAVLQQLTANKFVSLSEGASMPSVPKPGLGSLTKVGLINDGQQLLIRDTFAGGEYALLGFKGTTPGDSGIIYCPYIPISLQKIPALTATFTPAVGARTRYGIMNTPFDSKNYYSFIQVTGLDTEYAITGQRKFLQ